ncbi:polysaccharide pyruvyl transferase family protein [Flavobacteriaceae bacterium KMM 6898]|nr:polysaccharide pyruvyl transferase family protein [Flavobacteriaceae bacterium KMM 6898]
MIKNIVITHGYSDSNKGDLAITQATVDGLKKFYPKAKLTLLSTFREKDPDFWYHNRKMKRNDINIIQGILPTPYIGGEISFMINVFAVIRLLKDLMQLKCSKCTILGRLIGGRQYKAYKALEMADLVVVKGGQFIYNEKEDLRGNLFLWRTLQPIKVAYILKKRIVIASQSIGGFATEKSEKFAMKYIALCDKVLVREDLSLNLLRKYGIVNSEIVPDTAFYIEEEDVNIDLRLAQNREILGITVVNWSFPENINPKNANESYIHNLVLSIEESYNKFNLFPVFVPQVTVRHHGKSDLDLIYIIQERLNQKGIDSLVLKDDFNANEMVGVYAKCKMLIGTRLHSCILAAIAGTPIIAIRYQGFKTQGVMKMLGFENFVHDINHLKSKELTKDIEAISMNDAEIRLHLKTKVKQFREELNGMFRNLG